MNPESSPARDKKTVLLTGAARGLGLAISRRLVAEGYTVIGIGRRPSEEFDGLDGGQTQGRAYFRMYDLISTDGIHGLVTEITKEHGHLYGLINNAGIGLDGLLATMHATDIEKVLRVNLHAPLQLTKYAVRSMMLRGTGRIINISSIVATTGFSGLTVYAATKAGLEGMTRSLARELGRVGVTVNCVAPGFMETDMTSSLQGDKLESVRRRSPLELARVEDVAGAVNYLLSNDGARVTGTVLTVDGGSTA